MLDRRRAWCSIRELGFCAIGRTAKDARIVHDLYSHTIDVILRADRAGRLPGAPGEGHLRRRVLGPRAGEAAQGRQAAGVHRRDRARDGRRLGHRQGVRRGVSRNAARRSSASTSTATSSDAGRGRAGLSRHHLRRHLGAGGERGARQRRARPSAGSTCSCSTPAFFPGARVSRRSRTRSGSACTRSTSTPTSRCCANAIRCSSSRPRGGRVVVDRLEERARARARRRRLFGIESGADAARARRGAGVGRATASA